MRQEILITLHAKGWLVQGPRGDRGYFVEKSEAIDYARKEVRDLAQVPIIVEHNGIRELIPSTNSASS